MSLQERKIKNNYAILELLEKEIDLNASPVIFKPSLEHDAFRADFTTFNSEWSVKDGWLEGRNPDESAGMAILNNDFPGNILLEFEARTVDPSTHDINFMWNGEWDAAANSCGNGYIGSICGWYSGRVGIEKSPGYKLRATVPNKCFEPYRTYFVQAGSIDGNCFIFIDGELALEVDDPDPLDNNIFTKVAFTAWSSHIQVRDILIRQISWKPVSRKYIPEFI